MSKKIIVVFGATGAQGGSVVKSLLDDPRAVEQFKIRGVTRDPSKPNAKALAEKGVECVTGDLNSKDSLKAALDGAYAVYAVTNYWEKQSAELELQQGKNIADVSKECGIQHLIWSSLLNVTELTKGQFPNVHHFDSKAHVEDYIRSLGIPATYFMPGFYQSNIPGWMLRPNPQSEEHEWAFMMPIPGHTPIPLFDAKADTGKFVKGILLHRDQTLGKRIYAATDYYTCEQIVEEFKEVKPDLSKGARFIQISPEAYKQGLAAGGMDEVAQQELLENMQFMTDFGYFGKADLKESHAILDEKPTTWKEFLGKAQL